MGFGSQYVGNPIATQSPDYPPGPGQRASIYLAADTDGASWANTQQALKDLADKHAYATSALPSVFRQLHHCKQSYTTTQDPIPNFGDVTALINGASSALAFSEAGAISSAYNGRSALCTVGSASGMYSFIESATKVAPFANSGSLIFVWECDIAISATALLNCEALICLSDTQNPFSPTHYIQIGKAPGGTSWFVIWGGSGGAGPLQNLSNTYAPVASTFQRFRIEFFGSSTAQGVAAGNKNILNVYVNEALAGSYNPASTNTPSANCYIGAGGGWSANAGAATISVGHWLAQWNRY